MDNSKFYHDAIKEFGVSAQGVHWNNKYTQYKRFEILTKLIKKDIKSSSIIDVGCGFAEYYNYLQNNNRIPSKYIGIDCENDMVTISKRRFPNQEFYKQNILYDDLINADYYISSGALNILTIDEINIFIKNCFENSNKGFLFNFLKNLTFNNIKQYEILDICKTYTNNIITKENYLENDFTIFMVK